MEASGDLLVACVSAAKLDFWLCLFADLRCSEATLRRQCHDGDVGI